MLLDYVLISLSNQANIQGKKQVSLVQTAADQASSVEDIANEIQSQGRRQEEVRLAYADQQNTVAQMNNHVQDMGTQLDMLSELQRSIRG